MKRPGKEAAVRIGWVLSQGRCCGSHPISECPGLSPASTSDPASCSYILSGLSCELLVSTWLNPDICRYLREWIVTWMESLSPPLSLSLCLCRLVSQYVCFSNRCKEKLSFNSHCSPCLFSQWHRWCVANIPYLQKEHCSRFTCLLPTGSLFFWSSNIATKGINDQGIGKMFLRWAWNPTGLSRVYTHSHFCFYLWCGLISMT